MPNRSHDQHTFDSQLHSASVATQVPHVDETIYGVGIAPPRWQDGTSNHGVARSRNEIRIRNGLILYLAPFLKQAKAIA